MNQRATEYDLNDAQFEQLMDKYIMTIVDSMSTEDFRQFVINTYYDDLSNYTLSRLTWRDKIYIRWWNVRRVCKAN